MSTSTNSDPRATILVSCPDRRGIVAALAQLLYGHGANIVEADQYTDASAGRFFQRICFDIQELHTDRLTLEAGIKEVAERFSMRYRLSYSSQRQRVAIFVSKTNHCLLDLLWRHQTGELDCDIALVVSNHAELASLAEQHQVPFHHFPVEAETKAAQEEAELELLERERIDLIVLARYMQILSGELINHFTDRIINIHHSFLPAFVGGKPYHAAHRRGVKLIGATAHYATAELDDGPIIEQDVIRTSHRDGVPDLIRKGRDLEKLVLARAVRWHLEDRVLVDGNKTVVFGTA